MIPKRRSIPLVIAVVVVVAVLVGGVANLMIKPLSVAIAVTAVVVLVVLAIGLLPRVVQNRANSKNPK